MFPGDSRNIDISQSMAANYVYHTNVDVDIIRISSERLRRIADEHLAATRKRLAPVAFGTVLTAAGTLLTSEFRPTLGFSAAVLSFGYVLVVLGGLVYSLAGLYQRHRTSEPTADSLVEAAKGSAAQE